MIVLTRRRGQIYYGDSSPLAFTDDEGQLVTPVGTGPELIEALRRYPFDPQLVDGEIVTLDGAIVAKMTGAGIVAV